MSDIEQKNRRTTPRLLCNDNFSESSLATDSEMIFAQSINFNSQGIALFTSTPLPDVQSLTISFELRVVDELVDKTISIENLPCFIRHVYDMDVGSQYGIEFSVDDAQDSSLKDKLMRIEEILMQCDLGNDRYGVFLNETTPPSPAQ